MKILRAAVEKFVSSFSPRRKAQLLDFALSHIGEVAYFRLASRGFRPGGIIDIGAYHGDWSRLIARAFPQTPIVMIEAQTEKTPQLMNVCADLPQAKLEMILLGNQEGREAVFNVMETGSSLYSERSDVPRTQRILRMHTLDGTLARHPQLKPPLLIKLDVQGAEIDILKGGDRALALAEVVQLEMALVNYNEGAPDMNAVMDFMAARGFLFFNVCGFVTPDRQNVSQLDAIFVREDSPLRKNYFVFKKSSDE